MAASQIDLDLVVDLNMSFDMIRHHAYMHIQHASYHTKCLVMMDQSPITIRDRGANDLSPWQHIDRIVTLQLCT